MQLYHAGELESSAIGTRCAFTPLIETSPLSINNVLYYVTIILFYALFTTRHRYHYRYCPRRRVNLAVVVKALYKRQFLSP